MNYDSLAKLINECPMHRLMKLSVDSVDEEAGEVVIRLPFRPELGRSDTASQNHGGITAALIDIAGVYAIAAVIDKTAPTINMSVDYLRMGEGSDLLARARVIKAGRSIGIADVEVLDDKGRLIAVGRATYSTA
ncbi:MAG: PaaI family thioesterase [Pseudomonadota bacterium]